MLSSLKNALSEAITGKTACLFYSGGSDSLLLLNVLLDLKADFAVITFVTTFSSRQKRVLDDLAYEKGIRIYSYKPQTAYFIGDGERMAFIEEYAMPCGGTMPFIRDCVGGEKCSYDLMVETRPTAVPIRFELNIFGTRKTDRHWSWGKSFADAELTMGMGKILAPLWKWNRKQVLEALKEYGVK